MKKTFILFVILFIFSMFVKRPKYIELNNLKIIKEIDIYCDEIVLKEIIPVRDDNGIEYNYKNYKIKDTNIKNIDSNFYIKHSKIYDKCKK